MSERDVWVAVIVRALLDATLVGISKPEDMVAKRAAHAWLTSGSEDYRHVCALAGVDPEFLRRNYLVGAINTARARVH